MMKVQGFSQFKILNNKLANIMRNWKQFSTNAIQILENSDSGIYLFHYILVNLKEK